MSDNFMPSDDDATRPDSQNNECQTPLEENEHVNINYSLLS